MAGGQTPGIDRRMHGLVGGQQLHQLAAGNLQLAGGLGEPLLTPLKRVQGAADQQMVIAGVGPGAHLPSAAIWLQPLAIADPAQHQGEGQTHGLQGLEMIAKALAMILTLHRGAGRQMHQTYGGRRAIDMLATRAAGAHGVFTALREKLRVGQMVAHRRRAA